MRVKHGSEVFGLNESSKRLLSIMKINENVIEEAKLFNCPDHDESEKILNFPVYHIEANNSELEHGTRIIQFRKDSKLIRQEKTGIEYPFHFISNDRSKLCDTRYELVIVDDILKELSLRSNISNSNYVFISLLHSFKNEIEPRFLENIKKWLSSIALKNRRVTLIPDTDYFNRGVTSNSVGKVTRVLNVLGAYSKVLDLRVKGHECIGVDDYIQIYGQKAMQKLITNNNEGEQ